LLLWQKTVSAQGCSSQLHYLRYLVSTRLFKPMNSCKLHSTILWRWPTKSLPILVQAYSRVVSCWCAPHWRSLQIIRNSVDGCPLGLLVWLWYVVQVWLWSQVPSSY
jgi:hypothetical protein